MGKKWVKPCTSDPEPGVVEETIQNNPKMNHLMMLHVEEDKTDALTLVDVANDLVGEKENRKQMFGKFSANDVPNKFSAISSKSTQTEN